MDIAFLLTTLIVVATPGTGAIYTLAAGLSHGRRAGIIAAFGSTLGTLPHAAATITGLAALINTSEIAFTVVKYLGVAYLLYLAWSALRNPPTADVRPDAEARPALKVISSAVLINLLNPKLTVFFLAFLPQFVSATAPGATLRMIGLSAVFMLVTFAVFAVYGVAAALARDRVLSRPKVTTWMSRGFAATFVALGTTLAFAGK